MPAKRIIPCLDVKDGKTVKGVNFENLRYAGDCIELAKKYSDSGADELVFLDITATNEKRKTVVELVHRVGKNVFIPFTVGGGISDIEDIKCILKAGADKVSINSAAVKNPDLIKDCANYFGSQCITVAIDAKRTEGDYYVFINAGKINSGLKLIDWAKQVELNGAGEILLTSMDFDGTQKGFDIDMLNIVSNSVNIPVIASGGAGADAGHFIDVFNKTNVDAALAASIFHFDTLPVDKLKSELNLAGIETRRLVK
ncbi:TPA: imidazole glycerol phosphate synthase subunit HisF [Candidatus Galligastranaerophilus gallistercoris]|nr:imidazole glycerol phosphate synthase subunit HisF [Candidatus Galligastranaerophilus gallistercoris]